MRIARGGLEHSWEMRRAAALMLQRQLLLLQSKAIEEHDLWFVRLGLKRRKGIDEPLRREVLREGFSTRDVRSFVRSWRRRLMHPPGLLDRPGGSTLERWQHLAQAEHRIFLARYLFSPNEVVGRVLGCLRVTKGEEMPFTHDADLIRAEARQARETMPRYEARILELLCNPASVYWVSDETSRAIGSLVANPPGTVVVVVKPPGSLMEFEIKRTGTPTSLPLSVKFSRNGEMVPPSHRLQGVSLGWHLRFEARAAARFSHIYRIVHGKAPAITITQCVKSIHALPTGQGERSLVEFLGSPELVGDRFERMRAALQQCVRAAFEADDFGVSSLPGELGRTINFLIQTWPGQAVQSNTSCFRLDRLARYLSPDGAKHYFGVSLRKSADPPGAHEFGDQLFEEILGDFLRPRIRPRAYGRYLSEVFAKNRRRADRIYLDLLRELGRFWGTLVAVKGYSNGESFVSRNIGIRSAWVNSRWHVGLRFMDQDDLHLPDPRLNDFSPERLLKGMLLDQKFVQGSEGRPKRNSSLFALSQIYRVTPQVRAVGVGGLRRARNFAVRKTAAEMARNISLRDNFSPEFLKAGLTSDRLWVAYSQERGGKGGDRTLIDNLLKRFYPDASEVGRIKQHARALRDSAEHFLLNPNS
ncbi:MAG TPA: hypothetical protein VJU77_04800 [Chthoniobacterales bacterium]|nr:hypothetical protein [Chthoniobacterales bacterium]